MIEITKSPNADSRTADPDADVEQLRQSTESHISDVSEGLKFIAGLITARGGEHDHTKLENMEEFNAALKSGHVRDTAWYKNHITEERHHLKAHVPEDVTMIDVLEHLVDCTMAGLARSGEIFDTDISPDVLVLAAQNTVELLKSNVRVIDPQVEVEDEVID